MLVAVTSRGLLEIVVGKTIAYGIQAASVLAFVLVAMKRGQPARTPRTTPVIVLWWLLIVVATLSIWASSQSVNASGATIYALVMIFLGIVVGIFAGWDFHFSSTRGLGGVIMAVAVLMISVALLQQYAGLSVFPGIDFSTFGGAARPAAMTGSFLHYPIVLSLLAFALLGFFGATRQKAYLVVAIAALTSVALSYSRSGMVLTVVGLAAGFAMMLSAKLVVRGLVAVPLFAVVAFTALPTEDYLQRFGSIFSSDGAGNEGRIGAWKTIAALWTESPLLVGSHAGEFTNITSNLSAAGSVASPESGVLQVLISLGLLGVVGYYGLMLMAVVAVPSSTPWFRAGLVAAIGQSIVYQSIEVLPFMAVFAITPLVANAAIGGRVSPPGSRHSTNRRSPGRRPRSLVRR